MRGRWEEYWVRCEWSGSLLGLWHICNSFLSCFACVLMAREHCQFLHVVHVNCVHTLNSPLYPSLKFCLWFTSVQFDPFGSIGSLHFFCSTAAFYFEHVPWIAYISAARSCKLVNIIFWVFPPAIIHQVLAISGGDFLLSSFS